MSTEYRLSAVTTAAALHVLEEHNMDWKDWAEQSSDFSAQSGPRQGAQGHCLRLKSNSARRRGAAPYPGAPAG
jgi:hypothetical protein